MRARGASGVRSPNDVSKFVARGAMVGLSVWLIYGTVESGLAALIPWLWSSHRSVLHQNHLFLIFLLVLYGCFGAVVGVAWGSICSIWLRQPGLADRLNPDHLLEAGALISVLVVLVLNMAISYELEPSLLITLALCGAISLCVAARAFSGVGDGRLRLLTNPWSALVIVVGVGWLLLEVLRGHDSRLLKASAVVGFPLGVYGIARFARWIGQRWMGTGVAYRRLRLVLPLAVLSMFGAYWAYPLRRPLDEGIEAVTSDPSLPNIVLIILDTVRADHMSLYGYEVATTPKLEAFAREATLYSRATASSDMTLSSHGSIFTGLYAKSHGARFDPPERPFGVPLSEDFDTLAEVLLDMGYATLGVVANHGYAGRGMNMNQGFQYYDDRRGVPLLVPSHDLLIRQLVFDILSPLLPQSASDKGFRTAEEINEVVFGLLGEVAVANNPFFLFINYMDAHWPYTPPSPYDTLFPGKNESVRTADYVALERGVHAGERRVPETWRRHMVSQYDGALAYLDDQVALLIDRLKTLDAYDNTLIIITSDHGEAFGRRDLIGHGVSVYQDQVHVPLLVKWPNSEEGRRVQELVSHVDLFPTVLDLLGREATGPSAGVSLLELTPGTARHVVSESYLNRSLARRHPRHDRLERALFVGDWKLVVSSKGKRELYALHQDPNEHHDLSREEPEEAAALMDLLEHWRASHPDLLDDKRSADEKLEIDEETLERLRRLGYIQ